VLGEAAGMRPIRALIVPVNRGPLGKKWFSQLKRALSIAKFPVRLTFLQPPFGVYLEQATVVRPFCETYRVARKKLKELCRREVVRGVKAVEIICLLECLRNTYCEYFTLGAARELKRIKRADLAIMVTRDIPGDVGAFVSPDGEYAMVWEKLKSPMAVVIHELSEWLLLKAGAKEAHCTRADCIMYGSKQPRLRYCDGCRAKIVDAARKLGFALRG